MTLEIDELASKKDDLVLTFKHRDSGKESTYIPAVHSNRFSRYCLFRNEGGLWNFEAPRGKSQENFVVRKDDLEFNREDDSLILKNRI